MELSNEFRVAVPTPEAWAVLTDVERIAPCMPGAQLQEVEGDEYRGIVKVKVGPITAQYKGKATFVERDEVNHRAVLRAEGRDTRGQGNANATITATLVPDGPSATKVTVVTDLAVTGRVAQFGRGVLNDVTVKLLNQFVDCLHDDVLGGDAAAAPAEASPPPYDAATGTPIADQESVTKPSAVAVAEAGAEAKGSNGSNGTSAPTAAPASDTAAPSEPVIRKIEHREAAPVDLLDAAGGSVFKRAAPVLGALVFLLWVFRRRKKRRADRS